MHWFTKYPLLECPDCGSKELEHTLYVHHCSGDFQDVLQCGRCEKQLRDIHMRNDSDRVPDDFNPPGYTMNITEEWVRDPPEDEVWDAMWSTED